MRSRKQQFNLLFNMYHDSLKQCIFADYGIRPFGCDGKIKGWIFKRVVCTGSPRLCSHYYIEARTRKPRTKKVNIDDPQ